MKAAQEVRAADGGQKSMQTQKCPESTSALFTQPRGELVQWTLGGTQCLEVFTQAVGTSPDSRPLE